MSETSTDLILVVTTSDDAEELHAIAKLAVANRLAACCQISGPITSHFVWDGKPQRSEEWRCELKTTHGRYAELESTIRERHHYDEPEIVWLAIDGGSKSYLAWVQSSVM